MYKEGNRSGKINPYPISMPFRKKKRIHLVLDKSKAVDIYCKEIKIYRCCKIKLHSNDRNVIFAISYDVSSSYKTVREREFL